MEDMSGLMGVASPTTSFGYVYGEEQYLEAASSFDSQSGGNSPVSGTSHSSVPTEIKPLADPGHTTVRHVGLFARSEPLWQLWQPGRRGGRGNYNIKFSEQASTQTET
jgi:hypothetical protein